MYPRVNFRVKFIDNNLKVSNLFFSEKYSNYKISSALVFNLTEIWSVVVMEY